MHLELSFRRCGVICTFFALLMMSTGVWADFPNRPVDLICNYGPGGGADQFSRALSPILSKQLGVKVQL